MWVGGSGREASPNIFSPTCILSQFVNEFEGNDPINILLNQQHFQLLQPLFPGKNTNKFSKGKTVRNIDSVSKNETQCPSTSTNTHSVCKGKNARNSNNSDENHILAPSTSTSFNAPQSSSNKTQLSSSQKQNSKPAAATAIQKNIYEPVNSIKRKSIHLEQNIPNSIVFGVTYKAFMRHESSKRKHNLYSIPSFVSFLLSLQHCRKVWLMQWHKV